VPPTFGDQREALLLTPFGLARRQKPTALSVSELTMLSSRVDFPYGGDFLSDLIVTVFAFSDEQRLPQ